MGIVLFLTLGSLAGWVLFRKRTIPLCKRYQGHRTVSVIIPARNEAHNLPVLLQSLQQQTLQPAEIIVVDDGSDDDTQHVARQFGVKVVTNPPRPSGWTGKTWAVWNGYLASGGDILVFLDADVKLAPDALASLIRERDRQGGALSVVPYHETKTFQETFTLITNVLGMLAFTSPFETHNDGQGLYGSCIVISREDYEQIKGHSSICAEVLDDLKLGARLKQAGIRLNNYVGAPLVSFRMYPKGLHSALEGLAKSAALSTAQLKLSTVLLVAVWLVGLMISECFFFFAATTWFWPLAVGYVLYTLQLLYWTRYVGHFGKVMPFLHILSMIFFLVMLLYSMYQVSFRGTVVWKGREIEVGRSREG